MRYAVFISYPRASKSLTQWVSEFGRDLKDKLQEKSPGGQAEIFIDTSEVGPGPLTETLQAALADSAILLIVLSNRWFDSEWCHSELQAFVAATGETARSRIALVRLENVQKHRSNLTLWDVEWGDFLGGLREYDFFTIDPERKVTLVYGAPELTQLRRDYLLTLLELIGDEARPGLVSRIQEIHQGVQTRDNQAIQVRDDNRPKVFLADGTPDLSKDRRILRDYLEAEGYCVVPNRSFYSASLSDLADIQALLGSSELFIQVLGRFRFDNTDAFPDGFEAWQIAQARRLKGNDVLRWRRPDFKESDIDDATHRSFVFDNDVIACDLPEFKATLTAKLKEIHSRIDDIGRQIDQDAGKRVLFNVTSEDSTFGEELGARFEDLAVNAQFRDVYADLVSEHSSLYDIARNNIWHGLVVVYGQGQKEWALEQMRQARSAALADKRKPCRIYLRPPDKPAPEPRPVRFKLIRDGAQDELLQFLREVVAV
jgi:hypothetical protein